MRYLTIHVNHLQLHKTAVNEFTSTDSAAVMIHKFIFLRDSFQVCSFTSTIYKKITTAGYFLLFLNHTIPIFGAFVKDTFVLNHLIFYLISCIIRVWPSVKTILVTTRIWHLPIFCFFFGFNFSSLMSLGDKFSLSSS